ncbi:DNA polymerase, partial [Candidatus Liberibacter solanacearum]|uniref:DNA polymerase n=1 Tax=Candidatus Liberibacter solanacearum TaxID=556287 RepID=UPI00387DD215
TGLDLPDMAESTIATALSQPDIPQLSKDILNNRLSSSQSAILKLNTLSGAVSPDNRLRGTLQFFGASRTGRWSGCVFQPQNLPRQTLAVDELERLIRGLDSDVPIKDPLRFASDCVRSCVIAPKGKKLVVADLAGIEARVLAWVAGEQWKLNAFANGEDIYKTAYSKAFNIPISSVTKDQRAIGKVMELALGYQGGARVFQKMASNCGLDLQELSVSIKNTATTEEWEQAERRCLWMQETHPEFAVQDLFIGTACELVKGAWRAKHKGVVQLWKDCEEAFEYALTRQHSISARRCSEVVPPLRMWYTLGRLKLTLPSRRALIYFDARSDRSYLNTATSNLMRERTYGGKLTENIVQAISRDILAQGMINATKAGYDIVLTVHDEIVCETPDTPEFSSDNLCSLMTQKPKWAE